MRGRRLAALFAVLAFQAGGEARADERQGDVRRGKRIYQQGEGRDPVVALVGRDRMEVPGSVLPCVGCHGDDGEGEPEGGVEPSDIRWTSLSKPYGVEHSTGRRHQAYTPATLERAIVHGVDPDGQPLLVAMPRYRISGRDLEDLVAYLRGLGTYRDPGVYEDRVRFGTLVPTAGPGADVARRMKAVLTAAFEDVNARGGLFNRRIQLVEVPLHPGADAQRRAIEKADVLALVGGVLPPDTLGVIEGSEVPVVAPWTATPLSADGRYVFYLFSGERELSEALVDFAAGRKGRGSSAAAVIHPDSTTAEALARTVEAACRKKGWSRVLRRGYPAATPDGRALAAWGKRENVGDAFYLGTGGDLVELAKQAAASGWEIRLHALGIESGRALLTSGAPGRRVNTFLAFPSPPVSRTSSGARELSRLLGAARAQSGAGAAQVAAFAGARILLKGLQASGRLVSRDRLITALQGIYELDTGVTPPITFGPARRIGAMGACIVRYDGRTRNLVPERDWQSVVRYGR